ncbi:MAG: hypothetical protein HOM07_02495 [Rhodospirillaceae bacterium]|nr:hypothetical protein [Rhodospirillaceae bacterium]MBT5458664.1 hypothetical protein [Rhodospirillaceae bacterium]
MLDEMEFFRVSKNVWGQEMLLGVSWDLLWVPVAAAVAVIVLHQLARLISRRS